MPPLEHVAVQADPAEVPPQVQALALVWASGVDGHDLGAALPAEHNIANVACDRTECAVPVQQPCVPYSSKKGTPNY